MGDVMPLRFRRLPDILYGTKLNLTEGGAGSPPGGSGSVNIPKSWLVLGGVLVGLCGLFLCAALTINALSRPPRPTADQGAISTAVFATALQAGIRTAQAQSPTTLPSATLFPTLAEPPLESPAPPTRCTHQRSHTGRVLHSEQSPADCQGCGNCRRRHHQGPAGRRWQDVFAALHRHGHAGDESARPVHGRRGQGQKRCSRLWQDGYVDQGRLGGGSLRALTALRDCG